jgi:ABC-type multidrug transport system permease subunit
MRSRLERSFINAIPIYFVSIIFGSLLYYFFPNPFGNQIQPPPFPPEPWAGMIIGWMFLGLYLIVVGLEYLGLDD